MRPRSLLALLATWVLFTACACACVHHASALPEVAGGSSSHGQHGVVASVWLRGRHVARELVESRGGRSPAIDAALAANDGATVRYEVMTGEGPLPLLSDDLFALSLAPGRDGVVATSAARTVYLTPDDLLAHQAYRHGVRLPVVEAGLGVDAPLVLALLAEGLGTSVAELRRRATLRRVRFERPTPSNAPVAVDDAVSPDVLGAALAAARYVARGVDGSGHFRFLVDGATNQTLSGYDWPRHAGATYFLAQAAARAREPQLAGATLRAASQLRDHVARCGASRCVADGDVADLGASALATIAFVEVVRGGLDPSYRETVADLAAFLRGAQRPDGEFMHRYDRAMSRPIDVQFLYYSGEAALALSRAGSLSGDAGDVEAAARAVDRLVGAGWSFFGSRYYYGEEHWTCEAMADLWDRAPSPRALDFCVRWLAFWRTAQHDSDDTPYDADGAYGIGPVQVPPLTPVASRTEAGLATLAVAVRASLPRHLIDALDTQMKRSLALLVRQQLRSSSPSRLGLLADPDAVDGAFPASEVDWSLRVDFSQHAGSALLASEAIEAREPATAK